MVLQDREIKSRNIVYGNDKYLEKKDK